MKTDSIVSRRERGDAEGFASMDQNRNMNNPCILTEQEEQGDLKGEGSFYSKFSLPCLPGRQTGSQFSVHVVPGSPG